MTKQRTMRFATVAAGATIALALAGCGSSGTDDAAGGTTTLVWNMWSGSTAEADGWKHIGDMVTAKYPDIKLDFQTSSWPDYWTKLAAQASGGDAACILGVNSQNALSIKPLLLPLDDKLSAAGIVPAEFNESIMGAMKIDGAQIAIPYDFGPQVMFYNATRFQEAGIPEPAPGWTMDDFMADAKALTTDGKFGFALYPSLGTVVPWSLSRTGVDPVTDDGELDLLQPGFEETVQWYTDLVTKEKVAAEVTASTVTLNTFVAGDAAMFMDGIWQTVNVNGQVDFDLGIAPMPAGEHGSVSQVAGSGFGISQSCEDPEAAMKAISVITGPDALQYLAEQGRAYPARTAQQDVWFTPELASIRPGLEAAIADSVPARSTSTYGQMDALFTQYGVEAVNGQQAPKAFLEAVQQRVP